jgi:hypothetical protein
LSAIDALELIFCGDLAFDEFAILRIGLAHILGNLATCFQRLSCPPPLRKSDLDENDPRKWLIYGIILDPP